MYVQIIILHVFLPCHDKLRVASYPLGSLTCKHYFNKTLLKCFALCTYILFFNRNGVLRTDNIEFGKSFEQIIRFIYLLVI